MSNPRISLIHQINPTNAQQASLALAEANCLQEVITSVGYNSKLPVFKNYH